MADFKEYSRKRDIAVKRLKRLGVEAHVPTVKEIKSGKYDIETSFTNLTNFLETGRSRSKIRAEARLSVSPEKRREQRNERQRLYRRFKKAEEFRYSEAGSETGNYRSILKGANTLGFNMPPSEVPAFLAYMDYRFSQGTGAFAYAFSTFIDEYQELKRKGYSPDQMIGDYEQFVADQGEIRSRYNGMTGMTEEDVKTSWEHFVRR